MRMLSMRRVPEPAILVAIDTFTVGGAPGEGGASAPASCCMVVALAKLM